MLNPRFLGRLGRMLCMFAAVWGLNVPAVAQEVQLVTSFESGPPSGRFTFASWSPKTLAELINGNKTGEAVNILGQLFLPPGTAKAPAVILVHGSGGVYDELFDFWPKQFNAAGIAVFTLDMFGPRGVTSTAEDQSKVPFTADVADVFSALRLLATHPRIDARRIAVMGFSRGGTATLRASVERIAASQQLPDGLRFAAAIPTYAGGCNGIFRLVVKPGVFSKAPMMFIHGDADDYTPIGPCREYADQIGKAGTPVEFVTIEGAHHKFDAGDTRRHFLSRASKTKADCPIEVDINTFYAFDRTTGQRLQGEAYTTALKNCSTIGATVEGNTGARDKAAQAAVAFLKKAFAN